MAKISPVSIKYMIHANFRVEGALEKPDVIGAIFGQTEGLLGNDLEMRELQKEGKIGRIEVELDGKEVEELQGKEILMTLRRKITVSEFLARDRYPRRDFSRNGDSSEASERSEEEGSSRSEKSDFDDNSKTKLKGIFERNKGTGKAIFLDDSLEEIKSFSVQTLASSLKKARKKPFAIVIDGTANNMAIENAEEA